MSFVNLSHVNLTTSLPRRTWKDGRFIFHFHPRNCQPHSEGADSHYTTATSTASASVDNRQECKIPQSLGSGVGIRPKPICRLNGNSVVIPFSLFLFLLAFPRVQCHTFPPPQLNHLRRRKNIEGP